MRKIIRRLGRDPDLVEEFFPDNPENLPITPDDRLFLDLLKEYHAGKQYAYMEDWWETLEE